MDRKLYRSNVDSKIAGVCGGLGEYFNIDPTIVRIIAIILVFAHGAGLIGYIIAWIVMPKRPLGIEPEPAAAPTPKNSSIGKFLPGLILVVIGLVFLFENIYWWFDFWDFLWPALLIAAGLALVLSSVRKKEQPLESGSHIQEVK
ncbi:MAG: PspC domain-containing protein [Candidatus Zixiibacteriota bacterium]